MKSATKLEVLDLSSNLLYEPTILLDLLKSLPHLKVLDLSDNNLKVNWLAKSFKSLNNLRKLNVSGNVFNDEGNKPIQKNETFGSQLRHLKKLEVLDLSRIMYWSIVKFSHGLRNLKNLKQLNLSHCVINDSKIEELVKSIFLLDNLELLDMSHNLIEEFPFQLIKALNLIKEVNLSHNLLNLPISRLGIFWPVSVKTKLRRLNLSNNFLCGDDLEFQLFQKKFRFVNLQEIDLSGNNFYFYNEINSTVKLDILTKIIYIRNFSLIKDRAIVNYAGCICKYAGVKENYWERCFSALSA